MEETFKVHPPEEAKRYFENMVRFSLGPVDLDAYRREEKRDFNIIDVRAAKDYEEGHVPGAINLPEDQWESLKGLSSDKPNVIYCYTQTCHLAAHAAAFFASKGFPVMEMDGGFEDYREHEFEIEKGSQQKVKAAS